MLIFLIEKFGEIYYIKNSEISRIYTKNWISLFLSISLPKNEKMLNLYDGCNKYWYQPN
jgi:hypothetical protein